MKKSKLISSLLVTSVLGTSLGLSSVSALEETWTKDRVTIQSQPMIVVPTLPKLGEVNITSSTSTTVPVTIVNPNIPTTSSVISPTSTTLPNMKDTEGKSVENMNPNSDVMKKKMEEMKTNSTKMMITVEQQNQLKDILQGLETEVKNIRTNNTVDTVDVSLTKIDSLLSTSIDKIKGLGLPQDQTDRLVSSITQRLDIFKKNLSTTPSTVRKETTDSKSMINSKDLQKVDEKGVEQKRPQEVKDAKNTSTLNDTGKEKYKASFKQQLGDKIKSIPVEKLTRVLDNIDKLVGTIQSNTTLDQTKKDSLLIQLQAFREIISEQLNPTGPSTIDINSLLTQ